jgi:hypothetical protein
VSQDPLYRGIRTSGFREGSPSTSRVAKSRENRSRPSEEDRWQRSRDLMNSEVRRVRAQELGAPSREVAKSRGARIVVGSRSREDRWIRNPIAFRMHSGVRRLKGVIFNFRSREVPKDQDTRDTWQNHKVGPGNRQADTRHLVEGVNTLLTLAYQEFMK